MGAHTVLLKAAGAGSWQACVKGNKKSIVIEGIPKHPDE